MYVDPYQGTILGDRGTTEGFTNALLDLHVHLLSGETGEQVMGVVGLLTLLLVATGIVVWWPGVRRWWNGFTVRCRAGWKRLNFDLHRAGGIWSAVFLAVTASTGAALIFYQPFLTGVNWITASPPRPAPPAVVPRPGDRPLPLDSLLRRADRALPGGTTTYVSFPAAPDVPLTIRKWFDGEWHPNGRNFVHLDPWSGEVLGVESALHAPAGTRAANLLYPLHIGSFGGPGMRILYALLGLSPLVLFVSGCLMWWNRTQAPKRRRRPRAKDRAPLTRAVRPLREPDPVESPLAGTEAILRRAAPEPEADDRSWTRKFEYAAPEPPGLPVRAVQPGSDPREQNDRAGAGPRVTNHLTAALRAHMQRSGRLPWQPPR